MWENAFAVGFFLIALLALTLGVTRWVKDNTDETDEISAIPEQTEFTQSEQCTSYYEPPAKFLPLSNCECRQRIASEPQLTLAEHILIIASTIMSIATPFLL